jgi:ribonuclease G
MTMEIIINAVPEETRVALLENGVLTELYIDRKRDQGIVGNVYKGRVAKVLPGMQASFVDIGLERAAFLHVSDIAAFPEEAAARLEMNEVELEGDESEEEEEETEERRPRPKSRRRPTASIEELLQEGQEVVVQVSKEPMGTKGARVTGHLSFPGRYLVYMPTVNHLGVSRRIGHEEERHRLRDLVQRLRRSGAGYIIRTVSEGISDEEIRADIEFLDRVWVTLQEKKERQAAPSLLHSDLDLSFRIVRDLFTNKMDRLVIDSKTEFERIQTFVQTYLPHLGPKIELYSRGEPIFDAYGIELEISKALGRRVWLKSGGYIVIDHTEALTVIDVNTGRYVGKRNLEETILKTNLEAAKEIAYQLRLRNIGGLIIIDFIDMEVGKNRDKVFGSFKEAMGKDKARTHILRISELGLVELSRERTREDLLRVLSEPCSYCEGRGYTKSPATVCYEIFRELRRLGFSTKEKKVVVTVHPTVASLLYDEERKSVDELEKELLKKIIVKNDPALHMEQFEITPD